MHVFTHVSIPTATMQSDTKMANRKGFITRYWGEHRPRHKKMKRNLIMSLPAELRMYIYGLVFEGPKQVFLQPRSYGRHFCWAMPPLLCTSKQMRDDAGPMYYKSIHLLANNAFEFDYDDCAFTQIASAVAVAGPQPFNKITFHVTLPHWSRFIGLIPVLNMIRTTGLDPTTENVDPDIDHIDIQRSSRFRRGPNRSSMFRFEAGEHGCGVAQTSLETLIDLAKEAREEGWSEATFRVHIENVALDMRRTRAQLLLWDK